jgi:hypothetical protein
LTNPGRRHKLERMTLRARRGGLALTLILSGCSYVSFGRKISDDEYRLRREVKDFYAGVQSAFASGNAEALTALFSPSITHPMTHAEIRKWAEGFFRENKNGNFRIESLDIESVSFVQAVVLLKYRVETPEGKGSSATPWSRTAAFGTSPLGRK